MHATARVAAIIGGAGECNTVERVTLEDGAVRWEVRSASGRREAGMDSADPAVVEWVTELLAARLAVTACDPDQSTSGG